MTWLEEDGELVLYNLGSDGWFPHDKHFPEVQKGGVGAGVGGGAARMPSPYLVEIMPEMKSLSFSKVTLHLLEK